MHLFRSAPRPNVDPSKYPTGPEQFDPSSDISRQWRRMQEARAEQSRIHDLTARHEARRRECLAMIRNATADSDFADLAARQVEAQVLEQVLKPLVGERGRAAEKADFTRREFDRLWGKYQSLLLELRQGSSQVDRRPEDVQRELERML